MYSVDKGEFDTHDITSERGVHLGNIPTNSPMSPFGIYGTCYYCYLLGDLSLLTMSYAGECVKFSMTSLASVERRGSSKTGWEWKLATQTVFRRAP